uniref:Uncharacterized protein n=1 Tax=Lepeophtheirus salmonis TaxID=72036 RepID=A0A0K2UC75_LEPSM
MVWNTMWTKYLLLNLFLLHVLSTPMLGQINKNYSVVRPVFSFEPTKTYH